MAMQIDTWPRRLPDNTFSKKLSAILLEMFMDSLSLGSLPQTLIEALIILLLKPGKDNSGKDGSGSYRLEMRGWAIISSATASQNA